jgi:hypothetical protein
MDANDRFKLGMIPAYRLEDAHLRAPAGYVLRGIVGAFGQVYRLEKL